ncbi:response regulator [Stigmatella aurantiaca]|uniref:histidine kinase n=1 Tax=Stigmatella aurantiaca (strain DW4/3-1) TaxID=378806 RepID=Q090G4_STIAD|nr:response regulator [Stigmatella aurantiaca]ADO70811.1 Sensor protein [Stigmatella aurantiaca DW4/3-1]EAU66133.1 sensor histidine kinase/response regulator [Stigmatella aurantiaca DW4/3-1]
MKSTPPSPSSSVPSLGATRFGPVLPPAIFAGFVVAALAVLLIAVLSYRSLQDRLSTGELVTHTLEVVERLEALLSLVKDAETGQRGFLLTGVDSYLDPYSSAEMAIPGQLKHLQELLSDNPLQQRRLVEVERIIVGKMGELNDTIKLRQAGKSEAALALVRTDKGKVLMDRIRGTIEEMEREERGLLSTRNLELQQAATNSLLITWAGSLLLLVLIGAAGYMTSRDFRTRSIEAWLQAGQASLGGRMQGDQRLTQLGENVLQFLTGYLNAQVAAIYLAEPTGTFRRFAGYALPPALEGQTETIRPGEGLLGQAIREQRVFHLKDVPTDYLSISTSLSRGTPRHLLVVPARVDGGVNAVVELGFIHAVHPSDLEFLQRVSESIGIAVRSSHDRTRLEQLLEETQRQTEELQAQQEELRVSNEEIEEQSRVLKESQVRMEAQQAELEQTNVQLEEQTQLLAKQKDDLTNAQGTLAQKASELERTSRYKSEFLANMSHELRTPLNSSLILAKLLADNKEGNLTSEQVKFAQTISSAGNDLLALINDILDLSRIEAGKVEVQPEVVILRRTVEALLRTFQPVAQEKKLGFSISVQEDVAEKLETDPQRFGQILRNLLSNAFKFTEKGEVSLRVFPVGPGKVGFAVRDTGIGIAPHQQELIFEAFRQADGSTHRKYGGSGLGLSISRDLARLLGGEVTVQSQPGEGSTFTLTLPVVFARAGSPAEGAATPGNAPAFSASPPVRSVPGAPLGVPPPAGAPSVEPTKLELAGLEDDRERIATDSRVILVAEDDMRFAAILRDLARELGFLCIVTGTGGAALAAALSYRPSAILLDMNLPDHSGLAVLDQLKRNAKTRHIPVHVVSVADYSREALELGAVGYALKPVKREQLVEAFRKLETKFSQGLRRVLVLEDDERQRESLQKLLESEDVQIVGVATAGEALQQLQQHTFDCMVMDLHLPDLSGDELLEKMALQEDVSFPPVIVYTGHSLSRDEEQRLRRFSRSIIIKGVRSPERLLDEVTLFLHQVESKMPPERQRMLQVARDREAALEGRRILVVEDDVRNVFALSSVLEPRGAKVEIARNGREALEALTRSLAQPAKSVDLVLMDIMMPEMDGITAMREIRKRSEWSKLPIIALTAKAMRDDQEKCLAAGANDYIAKPLDVEKLLSLIRVWMPK